MTSLGNIEGISIPHIKQLAKRGIKTTQSLLAHGYTRKERKELAQATGLKEKSILEWVKKADILQVNGVGPKYAGLLGSAGVDTSKELANRKPEQLAEKIEQVNKKKKIVRKLPTFEQIQGWILDAISIHSAPHGLTGDRSVDLDLPLGEAEDPSTEPPPPPPPKKR